MMGIQKKLDVLVHLLEFFGEKNIPGRFKPDTKNQD